MPFISEAASAIKSRLGFQEQSSETMLSIRSTPDLLKSASKENLIQTSVSLSAIRNLGEKDDNFNSRPLSQSFEFNEDPSFWKDHNVQVIIRIRPLSTPEISLHGYNKCVKQESCQSITWTGHPASRFTFDLVADENVTQENLFKVAGVPMVENCVGGYNSCMFAYGQTGSGKTHTMLGDIEGGTRRHSVNCGMTPRVFEHLFSRIQKEKEARRDEKLRFSCKCSFLEIYNEQILDLLDPSSSNLQIREDIKKGVYVENLREVEVTSARDVIQQLLQGATNRKVAATNMNHASSRSHSVFTCIIESQWESQGVTHHRFARLNLVDLAGSERQKSSGAEGERLKEATNINKSLSTLGLVIMNLVSLSNGKSLHVPYRDSKLTFLLQDSLGGNSKTIIIANISPSSCCSLETLSTLKFAQRAKFIKNNAIINEDTSGDVLAMRMQIQQLKKEVSHLRGLVNGGAENLESDTMSVGFPGSPISFKWIGLQDSSNPSTPDRKLSQRKEYEVALVGAYKREKDKDVALQALTAENQAAMQLAKQREDEIQSLKMRLRFRESGIKRLEAVASGKISAEVHLLKEKEEHLREIEVLSAQVDRNQEVTRFAMENLRLKEEIRRLKSFCEEGGQEMMNQQIMILQNKLSEALDWKLMHESNPLTVERRNSDVFKVANADGNLMLSSKESGSPQWQSSVDEENEFLHLQAIQNQAEMETLRKKLNCCIKEKAELERRVKDLVEKLEEQKSIQSTKEMHQQKIPAELPSFSTDAPSIDLNGQMELKTMVEAIAAASQREAEAHEAAIILAKENDELRVKLKILIEDNNKLIELYERAVAETNCPTSDLTKFSEAKNLEKAVEDLEHQIADLHEENDKLMGLYEKAMQERDEFKRTLSSNARRNGETEEEIDCAEKLVEVDGEELLELDEAMDFEPREQKAEEPSEVGKPMGTSEPYSLPETTYTCGIDLRNDHLAINESLISDEQPSEAEIMHFESREQKAEESSEVGKPMGTGEPYPQPEKAYTCGIDVRNDHLAINESLISDEQPSGAEIMNFEPREQKAEEPSEAGKPIGTSEPYPQLEKTYACGIDMRNDHLAINESLISDEQPSEAEIMKEGSCEIKKPMDESYFPRLNVHGVPLEDGGNQVNEVKISNITEVNVPEDLNLVRTKLDRAHEELLTSAEFITVFGTLEKAIFETHKLSREIRETEAAVKSKLHESDNLKHSSSELREKRHLIHNRLSAIKHSLGRFSSSVEYFEQREARARQKVNASLSHSAETNAALARLRTHKDEIATALENSRLSEAELGNHLTCLESKLEEENQKQQNEKVLISIDNVERRAERNWGFVGNATELLKSEEEKTKLQYGIKQTREKLGTLKQEIENLSVESGKVERDMEAVEVELRKGTRAAEELQSALQRVVWEKELLMELKEEGDSEIGRAIIEYQQVMFEEQMKEEEIKILGEELESELKRMEELQRERSAATEEMAQLLEGRCHSCFLSEKMEEELQNVRISVLEAKSLLEFRPNES